MRRLPKNFIESNYETTNHRFERWPLAREITVVLVVKLLLLLAIWFICFRHPIDRELQSDDVANVLLSSDPIR